MNPLTVGATCSDILTVIFVSAPCAENNPTWSEINSANMLSPSTAAVPFTPPKLAVSESSAAFASDKTIVNSVALVATALTMSSATKSISVVPALSMSQKNLVKSKYSLTDAPASTPIVNKFVPAKVNVLLATSYS